MEGTRYELLKVDLPRKDQASRSRIKQFRHLGITFAFVFSIALISLLYLHQGPPSPFPVDSHEHTLHKGETQKCPSGLPPPASPPAPVNLWASLDLEDAVQIRQWLEAPERGLNLTRIDSYKTSDNTIYNLEAHYPPKADALAYLRSPSSVPVPDRYARVTIHHGARLKPVIKDYLVGPIPVSARTEMRELMNKRHRDGIPYNARGYIVDDKELHQFIGRVMSPLVNATKVSVVSLCFHVALY
jgi:primary-amine oxidase